MNSLVSVEKISKSFGEIKVLKDISIDIKESEVVSIVGPSGAGKTTLLQILGTLDKPDTGRVLFDGKEVFKQSDKLLSKFRNENLGFIFQFHQLLPEFTAIENVCIPALIGGQNKQKAEKKAEELLTFLGLKNRFHHKPAQLSGGEQQRVSVARSLINDAKLILADEPSGNLDTKNSEHLHQLFFDLRDEFNRTFVIITHNKNLADMADRKLEMSDGKILS